MVLNMTRKMLIPTFLLLLTKKLLSSAQGGPNLNNKFINENWTSCEEFLNNTSFDSDSIVDIDWKIFYFWSPEVEQSYNVRFTRPSKVLIDRFKVEFDEIMKPPVNWTDTDFFMETTIDFSALFLKSNRSGLFRIVPSHAFGYKTIIPMMTIAMKMVEPGYLGAINCMHRIGYALAPVDKMPPHYELEKAARRLQFFSNYNRSHIYMPPVVPFAPQQDLEDHDDQVDDEDVDIERDSNNLDFF